MSRDTGAGASTGCVSGTLGVASNSIATVYISVWTLSPPLFAPGGV